MVKRLLNHSSLKNSLLKGFIFLCILGMINFILGRVFTRVDFTQEKRFTLSSNSIQVLEGIKEPITVRVYLEGEFPAPFKRLEKETKEILDEFTAYSHGNLKVIFVDPNGSESNKNSSIRDTLLKYGIQPSNIQVKTKDGNVQKEVFPGSLVQSKSRMIAVNIMQNQNQMSSQGGIESLINNSVEGLEYTFIDAIKKVKDQNPPLIGLLEGNGELIGPGISDLVKTLRSSYRLGRVNINSFPLDSLIKIQLLILIKPETKFSEIQKYKLDQYIMHGGKILGFIDNVNAELDSMGKNGTTLGFPKDLNLDDFMFRLGVRMNYNLIRDLNCAPIPIMTGPEGSPNNQTLQPWVYYPLVLPSGNHPIVRNLDPVRLEFASSLDTIAVKGIRKTILLNTSPYTKIAATPASIALAEVSAPAEDTLAYRGGIKNVAVLLEGRFKSSFKNRTLDSSDHSLPFLESSAENSMILVSDGNLPINQVNSLEKTIYPLGYDKYSQQIFGNKIFVQNAIDYLVDKDKLLSLRSKEVKLRLLNKPLVEERKGLEQILNFLIPLLMVILIGIGFSLYRYFRFTGKANWLKK